MYLILKKGELRKIIRYSLDKAGGVKALVDKVKIPPSSIWEYYAESRSIRGDRLKKLEEYSGIKIKETDILKSFQDNWRQIKGGIKGVRLKKENGTFEEQLKFAREKNSEKLRQWHKKMKAERPEEYYKIQYSRFKKIGLDKFTTLNGEKVRNSFEKDVADILFKKRISYKYEPLVAVGKKAFFPDFLLDNNIIIECTMWRGSDKAIKLRNKIRKLGKNYKVFVVIPKNLYSYYKILDDNLIQGLEEFARVAQTFKS